MIVYYITKDGIKSDRVNPLGYIGIGEEHAIIRMYDPATKRFLKLSEVADMLTEKEIFLFNSENLDNSLWFIGSLGNLEQPRTRQIQNSLVEINTDKTKGYENILLLVSYVNGIAKVRIINYNEYPIYTQMAELRVTDGTTMASIEFTVPMDKDGNNIRYIPSNSAYECSINVNEEIAKRNTQTKTYLFSGFVLHWTDHYILANRNWSLNSEILHHTGIPEFPEVEIRKNPLVTKLDIV